MNLLQIDRALAYGREQGHTAANLFSAARQRKSFERFAATEYGKSCLEELRTGTQEALEEPLLSLSFSKYRLHHDTGSRKEYERDYFLNHRVRLHCAALCFLAEQDPKYLPAIEDAIWAICDEYTWTLPSHLFDSAMQDRSMDVLADVSPADGADFVLCPTVHSHEETVDLFSAETAFLLVELVSLLQENLHPLLKSRVKKLIYDRVLSPFMSVNSHFFWETVAMNWAAVCAGSVGCAAMYLLEDDRMLSPLLLRCCSAMEAFLEGFPEDGACSEGAAYWNYGYGFFTYFAALLKERTGGKLDLFTLPRARAAAVAYPQLFLMDNLAANFADCAQYPKLQPGLLYYLHNTYEDFTLPKNTLQHEFTEPWNGRTSKFSANLRSIIWIDPSLAPAPPANGQHYFPDTQWLICRGVQKGKPVAFAAKAGHNNEQHNHNDVGEFILAAGGEELLRDMGPGEYTRQYFGPERYTLLPNSSLGHSVPIVGGQAQSPGAEARAANVTANWEKDGAEASFSFEMQAAYPVSGLQRLHRSFLWKNGALRLTDTLEADTPLEFTQRFMTDLPPELSESGILLRGENTNLLLRYNAALLRAEIKEQLYSDFSGKTAKIYSIDLHARENVQKLTSVVEMQIE